VWRGSNAGAGKTGKNESSNDRRWTFIYSPWSGATGPTRRLGHRVDPRIKSEDDDGESGGEAMRTKLDSSDILIFRAYLDPKIFREIEISVSASLYRFAEAIIDAFDFDFDHAFGFYNKLTGNYYDAKLKYELFADMGDAEKGVLSVKKNSVLTAFPADKVKFLFIFDYGDEWGFKVERIGSDAKVKSVKYPRVTKSVGVAPPQYGYPEDEDGNV
jgi:hypothetical protein